MEILHSADRLRRHGLLERSHVGEQAEGAIEDSGAGVARADRIRMRVNMSDQALDKRQGGLGQPIDNLASLVDDLEAALEDLQRRLEAVCELGQMVQAERFFPHAPVIRLRLGAAQEHQLAQVQGLREVVEVVADGPDGREHPGGRRREEGGCVGGRLVQERG